MNRSSVEVPNALRRHFASHNRRVLLLLGLSLVLVAVGWILCYGVILWFLLLGRTLWSPMDSLAIPARFPLVFLAASSLLVAGLFVARRHHIEKLTDRTRWWQHLAALVLALPAATISLWGTFTAYQFLKPDEVQLAWILLRRIHQERRLPLHAVPQEIPDESTRNRVLVALQITDLIRVLSIGREIRLVLADEEARRLVGPRVRLLLPPR